MKKSALNRALALFLVVSALFTLPAFAANNSYVGKDVTITFRDSTSPSGPQLRSVPLADDSCTDSKNHPFNFSTNALNGRQVLITYTNTGTTRVNISITVVNRSSGETVGPVDGFLESGRTTTAELVENKEKGASFDVYITLSSNPGEVMSCSYVAIQGFNLF